MLATKAAVTPRASQPSTIHSSASARASGDPLRLPAGHFGLGHGSGAHAPDEYYVIESKNPRVQGMDGAALSHVEFLYELAQTS